MKTQIFFLAFLYFQSCRLNTKQNDCVANKLSDKPIPIIPDSTRISAITKIQTIHKLPQITLEHNPGILDGVWADNTNPDENALFEIVNDSIFYLESPERGYKYFINNKMMTIDLNGYIISQSIIKVNSDSLIVFRDNETIIFYKRK